MTSVNYPGEKLECEDNSKKVTCESALREQGIDEATIAKKLKSLLNAKTRRWNPSKRAFEVFDDYDTQLAAAREIVKILGGYPSEDSEGKDRPFILINDVFPPRSPRPDDREHCEPDSNVTGTVSEVLGNRTTSKA